MLLCRYAVTVGYDRPAAASYEARRKLREYPTY